MRSFNKNSAESLKGGIIMDVINVEQAKIAEATGAAAVMALERVPADIRVAGSVNRSSDPQMIYEIMEAVEIPVMAKVRIGHFVEAQVLEAIGVGMADESEVLSPADQVNHINKKDFQIPFVCGCRNLGKALRRTQEGAMMMWTKGEARTGNVVHIVTHLRTLDREIQETQALRDDKLFTRAKELGVSYDLLKYVKGNGELPVVNFSADGVATPADAALMMQLGVEGVSVGSGILKSGNPEQRAKAIVRAVANYKNPEVLAEVSRNLGEAMMGINEDEIKVIMRNR